ncbi:Gfo/Idh/MocA family protein [Brevibacillus sp. MS2.2]|uniref:Gfo/Idh/MocA family protein n=1 Tax=Brevibacillus sp. MS2.2 TaxID=2738981 RepID=UPI00156AB80B|nr:Gfo/Idh/MocA family oxidoreductase [Brevibacillus sp. MS2.2]NRR20069.1 Gfo/Idh/MocA family oxidoreductase [Brevibacillus sp. MS2.2]
MSIKVGIIGCGSIANERHAPEYHHHPNVELFLVFDPNPDRAQKLVAKYGGTVAASWREVVHHPEIQAISDCSTNEMHHIITTEALLAGKHVLCEKPIATTSEGAEVMLAAAEATGAILMIDHNQRLVIAHQKARQIIDSGELGRILSFKTSFGHKGPEHWSINKTNATWFFKKNRSALGVAGDLGIHKVDLLRYLLQDEIVQVSALTAILDKKDEEGLPIEVCDHMVCLLRTKSGAVGTASFSWSYYGEEDNSTILYGERGVMKIFADPEKDIEVITATGERRVERTGAIQTNDHQTNSGVIDAFVDAIQNQTTPIVTGKDGLIALLIIEAAMESAATGKTISLQQNIG